MTTEMAKKAETGAQAVQRPTHYFTPDVDILESGHEVRIVADLPGVDAGGLDVRVENGVLTIEGAIANPAPEGHTLLGGELTLGAYRRAFELSERVDASSIKARLKHGVLELTLPKREEARTRRITVNAG